MNIFNIEYNTKYKKIIKGIIKIIIVAVLSNILHMDIDKFLLNIKNILNNFLN